MSQPYYPVSEKPSLAYEELRDIIDLTLWAGQLLLQHGAESARVEETCHRLGTALGCDWMDVFISANAIIITASSGVDFRTKARRVPHLVVNMDIVIAINDLSRSVAAGQADRAAVGLELRRITALKHNYARWVAALSAGVGCAAFSRLFGGDLPVLLVTFAASSVAMLVRQQLTREHFNPFLTVIVTALIAGIIASAAAVFDLSQTPQVALAASVLLLVPGVPFLNGAEDILKGHSVIGFARGMTSGIVSLCIALGLLLAIGITNVSGILAPIQSNLNLAQDALWSGVAAVAFAVLFNVPLRLLPGCALTGALGHAVRLLLQRQFEVPLEAATLVGAVAVGVIGVELDRRYKVPASVFQIPGVIPMIPGSFAYRAMIGLVMLATTTPDAAQFLLVEASSNITKTGLILGALALGIAAPALIFERSRPAA